MTRALYELEKTHRTVDQPEMRGGGGEGLKSCLQMVSDSQKIYAQQEKELPATPVQICGNRDLQTPSEVWMHQLFSFPITRQKRLLLLLP